MKKISKRKAIFATLLFGIIISSLFFLKLRANYATLEGIKKGKVLEMTFDDGKIVNNVTNKTYSTTSSKAVITPSIVGQGLKLNGDTIQVPTGELYLRDVATVSFWVKNEDLALGSIPVSFATTSNIGTVYDLWFNGGRMGFNTGNGDQYGVSWNDNKYRHITAVFNKGNLSGNKLYIDGVPVTINQTGTVTTSNLQFFDYFVIGGTIQPTSWRLPNSNIDEIGVWNRELNANEIKLLHDSQKQVYNSALPSEAIRFSFDKGSLTNEVNGKNYTSTKNSLTYITGTNGKGIQLNNDQIKIPITDVNPQNGEFTVSFYMNPKGESNKMPFSLDYYDLYLVNGAFGFNSYGGDAYGVPFPSTDKFTHIVAVFNSTNYTLNDLYVDGVKQKTSLQTGTTQPTNFKFGDYIIINGGIGGDYTFASGILDEYSVYNRRLTPDEIQGIYARIFNERNNYNRYDSTEEYGKVAHFKFENQIKNDVNNKVYSSTSNKVGYMPGVTQMALQYNGDQAKIPITDLNLQDSDYMTTAFWFKWGGDSPIMPIALNNYDMYIPDDSTVSFNSSDNIFQTGDSVAKGSLLDKQWHYLTLIWNNGDMSKNKIFIDGYGYPLSLTYGFFNDNARWGSSDYLHIGGWTLTNGYLPTTSLIDELTVYNRALTGEEISSIYFNKMQIPELKTYQNGLNAKTEWATDIMDANMLWAVGYEPNEQPTLRLVYENGNGLGTGQQSFTTEDKYKGSYAYKIGNTYPYLGNGVPWPYTSKTNTSQMFYNNAIALPNGANISASFRVKSVSGANIELFSDWVYRNSFNYYSGIYATVEAPAGTKILKVNNASGFSKGSHVTSDSDPYAQTENNYVYDLDYASNTLTLASPLKYTIKSGDQIKKRNTGSAFSFTTKSIGVTGNDWTLVNINGKTTNYPDLDWTKTPIVLRQAVSSNGDTYIDDLRVGYATEVVLFRDGVQVYQGFLSEYNDTSAIDKVSPSMVSNIKTNKTGDNLSISYTPSTDEGTLYTYQIRSRASGVSTQNSLEKRVTVVSGVKGYSYAIDKSPSTEPDNVVDITSTNINTTILDGGKYYLHIKAIDNQGNVSSTVHRVIEIPNLVATPNPSSNFINLNWDIGTTNQPYTYKAYQLKEGDTSFQSISASALKDTVKVLNIYPVVADTISFTNWKGQSFTLPKSASVKMWMEAPNTDDPKGYGKGLIDVDAVAISDFNSNPLSYLKNADGTWKYDAVFIGAWNVNGRQDITQGGADLIKQFIQDGRGYLSGHDTIWSNRTALNTRQFRNYINIKIGSYYEGTDLYPTGTVDFPSATTYPNIIMSNRVQISKKGLLTSYPWNIGSLGTVLSVPYSHTTSEFAYGDVWIKYANQTETLSPDGLGGTNNFYLTTWNNTAQIETGHSNGDATNDEQKVIANTLFYLAQITTGTHLDDHSGQDVKAPTTPAITSAKLVNSGTQVGINFTTSNDQGSTYDYYVEATGQNTGEKLESNKETTTITTGLKGYSIVVDSTSNTIPDNVVETTSLSYTAEKPQGSELYVHIRAVDNVGNASDTAHFKVEDFTPPSLTLALNPNTWTNGSVNIIATATDNDSGVKQIKLPNGNIIGGNTATYTVAQNGVYYFEAVDYIGNKTVQYIVVDKIDANKPSVSINNNQNWNNSSGVPVTISGSDQ